MATTTEVVLEEKKDNTLAKLINALSDTETAKKLSTPVDPTILSLVKTIMDKLPNSTLSTRLDEIVKDGKLDTSDIPNIVLIVTQLHNSELKTVVDAPLDSKSVTALIQFLIHSLIDLQFIKVENPEKVYAVLDSSLELLQISLDIGVPAVNIRSCC